MKKKFKYLTLILLTILISGLYSGLLQKGCFISDDGSHLLIRMGAAWKALGEGQLPLRWSGSLNHGFGYPVFNFLYPLYLYLGAFIHIFGVGLVSSFKIILLSAVLASFFTCFLFLSLFFAFEPALAGALFYVLANYRWQQVFVRASVGEVLAMALAPLVFYFAISLRNNKDSFYIIGLAVSLAMLILSHNTLSLLFVLLFVGFLILNFYHSKEYLFRVGLSLILGLGLSAFFWFPAIMERNFTYSALLPVSDFNNYFLNWKELFNGRINLGFFIPPFLLIGFWYLIKRKSKNYNAWFFALASVVLILLTFNSGVSKALWNISHLESIVQFPWRILALVVFCSSFVVAYCFRQANAPKLVLVVFFVWQIINVVKFVKPERSFYPDEYYLTNDGTTTTKNEFLPIWVKEPMGQRVENLAFFYDKNGIQVEENYRIIEQKENIIVLSVDNKDEIKVVLNKVYFPGWTVNGKKAHYNDNGLIDFELAPVGERSDSEVTVLFQNTTIRIISNIITLVSFFILLVVFGKNAYAKRFYEKK